jgi:hypothetical protein
MIMAKNVPVASIVPTAPQLPEPEIDALLEDLSEKPAKPKRVAPPPAKPSEAPKQKRIGTTIYLPPKLHRKLKVRAAELGNEMSELVTDALEAFFK